MPAITPEATNIACKIFGQSDTEDSETVCFQKACFASWKEVDNVVTVFEKGCYNYYDEENCSDTCTPFVSKWKVQGPDVTANHHYCCCTQNLCNEFVQSGNITDDEDLNAMFQNSEPTAIASNAGFETVSFPVVAICMIMLSLYCGKRYLPVVVKCIKPEKERHTGKLLAHTCQELDQCLEVSVAAAIHQGRYGKISLGQIGKKSGVICIKEFNISTAQGRKLYRCEKRCHSLLQQFNHKNIVKYFGIAEKSMSNPRIVLEYCPQGSLRKFLKQYSIDLRTCLNIVKDVTGAVSFLQNPGAPPLLHGMAHRDISSGNFLVKCDTTVVLSDFGFSIPLNNAGENQRDKSDLTAAGTPNYMAPEILKGTINLNNYASALKQADVYSMALVLWEVICRCYAFYDERCEVPEATVPYQTEMKDGNDLYYLVVDRGIRPKFPQMRKPRKKMIYSTPSQSSFDSGNASDTLSLLSQSSDKEVPGCTRVYDDASSEAPCKVKIVKDKAQTNSNNAMGQKSHMVDEHQKRRYRDKCFSVLKKTVQESWDAEEDARLTASSVYDRVAACLLGDKM